MTDVTDSDRKSSGNKDLVCTNKDNRGGKRGEVGGWRMGRHWKTRGEVSAMHNPFHRMCHATVPPLCKQICISCNICYQPKRTWPLTVQNLMKYCNTVAAMNKQYTRE